MDYSSSVLEILGGNDGITDHHVEKTLLLTRDKCKSKQELEHLELHGLCIPPWLNSKNENAGATCRLSSQVCTVFFS